MTDMTFQPLSLQDIRNIEAEAQRLRGEAMAAMITGAFRWVVSLPKKLTTSPNCARPLHP